MIRLALRLTLNGGREAAVRLLITAIAVSLGVCMLLLTLAAINGVNTQNARYTWLNAGFGGPSTSASVAPTLLRLEGDTFRGRTIARVDVAPTGADSPVPPGIPRLPRPGDFYVSPALSKLLASTPATELGNRYGGRQIGIIGDDALPAPNSLIIVIGHTEAELATSGHAARVTDFQQTGPGGCGCYSIGINPNGIDLILAITAGGLLFPVVVFIGSATRLSAARREQRFAAMRLVGATIGQISIIAAVEAGVAAVIGAGLGFVEFFALRAPVATIPFTGAPFFASDLSPNLVDVLLVVIGVPLAAVLAARVALRRVAISPLGVNRRVTPEAPHATRLIPLILGIAELGYFVVVGRPATSDGQIAAYLSGILVIMSGLVIAGPWLTMVGARLIARRTNRPAVLLAGRRLADNPQAAFRAMSGLVLALFITSVAVGVITTIVDYRGVSTGDLTSTSTLVDDLGNPYSPEAGYPKLAESSAVTSVGAIPGVRVVVPILPASFPGPPGVAPTTKPVPAHSGAKPSPETFLGPRSVISCADLAQAPFLGRCPAGASAAVIVPDIYGGGFGRQEFSDAHTVWPAASAAQVRTATGLGVQTILVLTNGSRSAIERARTALEAAYPDRPVAPFTIDEQLRQNSGQLAGYQRLADLVILATLPIAGCSLAVSAAAGLTERKRPFSLLRLAGAPLGVLRRVIALESAVPLLFGAVVAIGAGFLAAALFLRSQLHYPLHGPDVEYYLIVLAGLLASLAIVGSTMPFLSRVTGPEAARND